MDILPGNDAKYDSSNLSKVSGSKLEGKNILFLGSSVTFGAASMEDGIPEHFAAKCGCTYTKEAVSGTTLVDNDESSYVSRLINNTDTKVKYDLVIVQLSTNDATQGKPLGEISATGLSNNISDTDCECSYDRKTITGAMEFIISYCIDNWHCPVFFYTGSRYESDNYKAMVARLYELSRKWDVGVIDLWSEDEFNDISDEKRSLYMADPIHPTKAGYHMWWCPEMLRQLEEKLK